MRPITNCNFLFLNKNNAINDSIADAKNKRGITLKNNASLKNKSTTNIFSLIVFHKLNTKISPPETIDANSK